MELLLSECLTFGNIVFAVVLLLILNQLIELYQFRSMPPGPRLTSLPLVGNLMSFDSGESFSEVTARFVYAVIITLALQSRKLPYLSLIFFYQLNSV